jgi:bifunctional DNA-binding transcriptional regulator/antitoxin component of YhaV-PrlF toxin-antitoxin module
LEGREGGEVATVLYRAREALELKSGDKVLVPVRGKRVRVLQKPSHREAIRGLAGPGFPHRHIQKERQSWE